MTTEDVHRLLQRLAPIVAEGLASPAVADQVVAIVLEGDGPDAPAEVLILDRWRYLHAISAARGRREGDDGRAPAGSIRVSIASGTSAIELDAPDPRTRPQWWGLPAEQSPRPALGPLRSVRRGLTSLRSLLGHPGGR